MGVVGEEDLRPMHHRRGDEAQHMAAQGEGIALLDDAAAALKALAEERLHHGKGLGGGDDDGIRVSRGEGQDAARVIRLHMLHDEIVRRAAVQRLFQIGKPSLRKMLVHAVHDGNLFIHDGVGIIGHAVRHSILPLEQVDFVVIDADVENIVHGIRPPCLLSMVRLLCQSFRKAAKFTSLRRGCSRHHADFGESCAIIVQGIRLLRNGQINLKCGRRWRG